MLRAHLQIYEGTSGRRDMVQGLQRKWEQQAQANWTEPQQWQNFKVFYCTTFKEYNQIGLTTVKPRQANSSESGSNQPPTQLIL